MVSLIPFVLAFDPDGGPKLQRAAAVQKEEKRGLQSGDRGGREARENPQMYCGESAGFFGLHAGLSSSFYRLSACASHSGGFIYMYVHGLQLEG